MPKIGILDQVLTKFPGVKQSDPVENALFIRFTVQLQTDPSSQDRPPEIHVQFAQGEFMKASTIPNELERLFRERITETSFTDQLNGATVRTNLKEIGGVWGAIDVNGQTWQWDQNQGYWIKGPFLL